MTAALSNPKMDPLPGVGSLAMMLRIQSLEARYGESSVLRDVNIEVPDGKLVSLMGRNGVGKTTTLKSIMGILPQSAGEIIFAGKSWRREPPETRARAGMITFRCAAGPENGRNSSAFCKADLCAGQTSADRSGARKA